MAYANKDDKKRYNHEWHLKRKNNPEYVAKKKEYDKIYHKGYKNPNLTKEKSKSYSEKYRDKNIEEIKKKNREYKKKIYSKIYQKKKEFLKDPENKKQYLEKSRQYQEKYKSNGASRKTHLKFRYGITPEDFNQILSFQGEVCPVCGGPFDENRKGYIDHCHKTERIRGILHMQCNTLLGMAKDKVEILKNAINYLERTGE